MPKIEWPGRYLPSMRVALGSAILNYLVMVCSLTVARTIGQETPPPIEMRVDASASNGTLPRAWTYFGYDEPNFTYSPNGKKLLQELAELSPAPVYIRTHNLLTSGDGK